MSKPDLFATTRQLTGLPYIHRAYVYSRASGKPIKACLHNHRGQTFAQACADKMLRQSKRKEPKP